MTVTGVRIVSVDAPRRHRWQVRRAPFGATFFTTNVHGHWSSAGNQLLAKSPLYSLSYASGYAGNMGAGQSAPKITKQDRAILEFVRL